MARNHLPVILLLGAKSAHRPLVSIPAELSALKALLDQHKQADPAFVPEYEPYFTQELLKTKLEQLSGQVAVLHFAGHSDAEALVTDGAVVYAQHIAAILGTWRNPPSLIFLNGCHNAGQVKLFHDAGVPVVIATRRAVDDGQAAGFAREFYASLFAEGGQVGVKAAFGRAGSKLLLGENRQARSLDIGGLAQADAEGWDWGLFARQPEQESWTLRQLLTHERPRYDANGVLVNPYQGLKAFREEDRAWFFGRDALTAELCDRIPATPLFTLLGASGSGKSSLVSAGVIPSLRDTGAWLIFSVRPGFAELAEAFARELFPGSVADRLSEQKKLAHKLQTHDIALPELLVSVRDAAGKPQALLCIDQFEELFTHAADQASVQAFQAQLIALVTAALPGCCLLLVMRADFLAAALANPAFADLLDQHASKFLGAMGQAELRAAIVEPARRQQVSIDPDLTAALLDAVEHQPGSLPLLQYVLSLLWEQRRDHRIVLEDYNRLGGLEKALETRANAIFDSFSASEQEQAKGVFLRLIQPGEGTEDTRRRAQLGEFSDNPEAQRVIKQLTDERLITTQQADNREAAFAEVSHEALIRHWGKLQGWLEASRETLRTQHQISAGARAWEENQRDSSWLLTGSRLAVAEDWLEKYADRANVLEQEYIRAGVVERDRQAEEQEQQRQRELALQEEKRVLAEQKAEEQRKSLKKNRRLSWVMAMIALVMIVAAGFAWHFATESDRVAAEAKKNELEANYNLAKAFEEKVHSELDKWEKSKKTISLQKAWLYALEAEQRSLPGGRVALDSMSFSRLSSYADQMVSPERKQTPALNLNTWIPVLAYSPDGEVFASGSSDNKVYLWDADTGELLKALQGHNGSVINALAFSPDGKVVASGSSDHTIRLWDVQSGEALKILQGHDGWIKTLVYSPDGKVIASGSSDHTIRLWDAYSGEQLKTLQGHTASINALAYSPDGKVVASGSDDRTIRLWDVQNGVTLKILQGHIGPVNALTYSPDGKVIASVAGDISSNDPLIRLWDLQSGIVLKTLQGHTASINALAYSPDGKVVASGSNDRTVRLWDVQNGVTLKTLQGHTSFVNTLAYSPDGKIIVSGASNSIRLWDVQSGESLQDHHEDTILTIAYSPDGKVVASGSDNHTVQLWDAQNGVAVYTLHGHTAAVRALAYSPDGKVIASGSDDQMVRLWDVQNRVSLQILHGHTAAVSALAYSPDGKVIVSGSSDGIVRLWDAQSAILLKTLQGHNGRVAALAYSPDGRVIASGSFDHTVRLWDAQSGKLLKTLKDHSSWVQTLAYSPNGKVIASGSDDNTVRLWDSQKGELLKTLQGHTSGINVLTYSPDSKVIASGSGDNTVRLWDSQNGELLKTLQGHTSAVCALAYSPDSKIITSSSYDNTLRWWDTYSGEPLKTLRGHTGSINALVYSPDGKVIASGSGDNTVRLWDSQKGELLKTLQGHRDPVHALAYSPDSKIIASGAGSLPIDSSNLIRLWDATTGKTLKTLQGHTDAVQTLAYSPDGKVIASGSGDKTVRLWDSKNGELLKILQGHRDSVKALAYKPDGKVIASGSSDSTVRLWDAHSGILLETLQGHTDPVNTLAFSPDGNVVASGSGFVSSIDNTVRLWDAQSGVTLKMLQGHTDPVNTLAFSPDGNVVASGSGGFGFASVSVNPDGDVAIIGSGNLPGQDNTVRLWDAREGVPLKTMQGNMDSVSALAYSPDGNTIASGSFDNSVRLWTPDIPQALRLLRDFDPAFVSASLRFLWQLDLSELEFEPSPHPPALLPYMGYYITWTDETRRFRPLLDMPNSDETKLGQVVRFLESQCAYKDPQAKADCQSKQPAQ